jgi:hemerythrin-like domain-containing protein
VQSFAPLRLCVVVGLEEEMADAVDTLKSEHRIIEKVLDALELAAGRDVHAGFYQRAIEFLSAFADRCHHGKEEDRLFPCLERCGIPRDGGPIGVMCAEHVIGRAHIGRMREHLEAARIGDLRIESLEYVALMRQHIAKEDHVLFEMARHVMGPSDARRVSREFDEVDGGGRPQEKFGAVADALFAEAQR